MPDTEQRTHAMRAELTDEALLANLQRDALDLMGAIAIGLVRVAAGQ